MKQLNEEVELEIKNRERVALYLRLSDEDRHKLSSDQLSESIKNQENMLREYADDMGWQVVGVYNDEDWSGGDCTRPEFNKMISECEKGNVDVVLVKSQSRFARDSELIEKYVHNLFHQWNVKFQTYIEKIDNTKRETKKTSQIIGLTDQWYLEDTSINIRETFRNKRKLGQFTGAFASYGYIKDPENKNHLIPDFVAAEVVKRIYNNYFNGDGLEKIACDLNNEKIPSPLEYKILNGSKIQIPLVKQYLNYEYIEKVGTYVINVTFTNNETQILKNLITFNYLTTDRKTFNNKCHITLKQYSNQKMKVYYSIKENLNISKFDERDFILLNEDEEVPKNATCIATTTGELDRTHMIRYQFEVRLKDNISHDKFYFNVENYVDNIDGDLDFKINIRKKLQWCSQTVKKILQDEVYIGNMVQFKTTTVSYKNHAIIHNHKEDWIRKNNTHTGIIDPVTWFIVQKRIQEKSRSCSDGRVHIFNNKVFCSNCGRVFAKCGKKQKRGLAYLCCKDKKDKWVNCDNKKYLREEELHNFILGKINDLLERFYDENILNELNEKMVKHDLFEEKLINLEKELNTINKNLQNKCSYFQRLYEDRTCGLLPEKEFVILMNKYRDDRIKLEDRIKIVKREIEGLNVRKNELKTKSNIFIKNQHIDKLDADIINNFIDRVMIGYIDSKTGLRDIKIVWNFTV